MRKGFLYDKHPAYPPDLFSIVYKLGIVGKDILQDFGTWWNDTEPSKRGILAQPKITAEVSVNDCASWLKTLLDTYNPAWKNGIPPIIDINLPHSGFGLDQVYTFRNYVRNHWGDTRLDPQGNVIKLLLRVNKATWQGWATSAPAIANSLLDTFEILLVQPGAARPSSLTLVGTPKWLEYDWDEYKNDPTGNWDTDPVNPPEEPPVEDDPGDDEPPIISGTWIIKSMDGTPLFKIEREQ